MRYSSIFQDCSKIKRWIDLFYIMLNTNESVLDMWLHKQEGWIMCFKKIDFEKLWDLKLKFENILKLSSGKIKLHNVKCINLKS